MNSNKIIGGCSDFIISYIYLIYVRFLRGKIFVGYVAYNFQHSFYESMLLLRVNIKAQNFHPSIMFLL